MYLINDVNNVVLEKNGHWFLLIKFKTIKIARECEAFFASQ